MSLVKLQNEDKNNLNNSYYDKDLYELCERIEEEERQRNCDNTTERMKDEYENSLQCPYYDKQLYEICEKIEKDNITVNIPSSNFTR